MTKRKTDPNHKASFGVVVGCSCGWTSSAWYGNGARGNAAAEWHMHRDKCEGIEPDNTRNYIDPPYDL